MEVGRSGGAHVRGRGGALSGLRGAAERVRRSEGGGPSAHGREEKVVRREERGKKRKEEKRKGKGKWKKKKEKGEKGEEREKKRERERFAPALIMASTTAGRPRARCRATRSASREVGKRRWDIGCSGGS